MAGRNTLGVALAVGLAALAGLPAAQRSAFILGAMFVSNSDRSDSYRVRGGRMMWASLLCAAAVLLAGLASPWNWLVGLLGAFLGFCGGLVVVLDQTATDLGVISLVAFVLFAAQPTPPEQAPHMSLLVLLGGLIQTALSLALWPARRYRPEQRELGQLFQSLASVALSKDEPDQVPSGSEATTQAQDALRAIATDRNPESSRYRSLLSQAERIRLNLIVLGRLQRRLQDRAHEADSLAVQSYLEGVSGFLQELSAFLLTGKRGDMLWTAQALPSELAADDHGGFLRATRKDVVYHTQTLDGQLRAVRDLAQEVTLEGQIQVKAKERAKPWYLRVGGTLVTLQANLHLRSPGFRHAVRLAVCLGACEMLIHRLDLMRPYWVPMTVILVLKPEFASTVSRFVLRIGGTMVGLVLSTVLFHLLPPDSFWQIGLFLLFTFVLKWLGPANYGVLALCVSGQVVVLLALVGISPKEVVGARLLGTLIGAGVALLAYLIWPTREKEQISELLARLLDSYGRYFSLIADFKEHGEDLDKLRWQVRADRSRVVAARERLLLEPAVTEEERQLLAALSASSNRFAHAAIEIETASTGHLSAEEMTGLAHFAAEVHKFLELQARALRERHRPSHQDIPKLRSRFVELEKSFAANRSEPVLHEMDRITNSLSTLGEQLETWAGTSLAKRSKIP